MQQTINTIINTQLFEAYNTRVSFSLRSWIENLVIMMNNNQETRDIEVMMMQQMETTRDLVA